jgi:hypothetical protein
VSTEASSSSARPAELVAGFLSVISIAASIVGLVWYPMRFTPFAVLIALIAAAMSPKNARLPVAAVAVGAICFVVGLTIAVATDNPIY